MAMSTGGKILGQVFEGLTKWDENHMPQPALAQLWTTADAQNWTFILRPDVIFHNGRPLTAQDVVYSWNRIRYSGHKGYGAAMAPLLKEATAVATHTLQVTLKQPYAPFPSLLALTFMAVVPPESLGSVNTHPVGAGPFRFQSWTPGERVVLIANQDYYDGRPYLDSITFQFYADEYEMYDEFLAGNLDLSPVPCDRAQVALNDPSTIVVDRVGTHYYGMKVDQPPFDDVRARQALNYAVDRQSIVNEVAPCFQTAACAVPPVMHTYDQPGPSYTYNPDLALDLLAQAGWMDTNEDGVLDDGAGTDLTIELWHDDGFDHAVIAQALVEDFGDIGGSGLGAVTTVNSLYWLTYFTDIDQFPMFRLSWFNDYPDPLNFLEPHFQTKNAAHLTNYSNEQVDAWLLQAVTTLDWSDRQTLYKNIEAQVQKDAPFISLYHPMQMYVKGNDVSELIIPSSNWYMGLGIIQMEMVQLR